VHVHVDCQAREKQAGQAADGEKPNKTERIPHRRLKADRTFVQRGRPVEDLYGRGNRNHEAEQGKNHPRVNRLAAHEHVMAPDKKPKHADGDTREGNKLVAEKWFARKTRYQLANDAHFRQNHNVNRGVRRA
jgi:hypothetical protein